MTWAQWMDIDPVRAGVGVLLFIFLSAIGYRPVRSLIRKAEEKNNADAAEETLRKSRIRREDTWDSRADHLRERAVEDLSECRKELEEFRSERDVEREAMRARHHAERDEWQAQLMKKELEFLAKVREIAAEADRRVAEVRDELRELRERFDEVSRSNRDLIRQLKRAGFDPARSDTGETR